MSSAARRAVKVILFRAGAVRRDADDMEGSPVEGRITESDPFPYVTNDLGDIYGLRGDDGTVEPFDPDTFGWVTRRRLLSTENRRSHDQIETLPGFSVTDEPGRRLVPGQRPQRVPPILQLKNGAAPPAAVESRAGRLVTYDRLTNALGILARRLPPRPDRSTVIVHDFVGSRRIIVDYKPPPLEPSGAGTVYVVDDGHAFKIGHTNGHVAKRIADLQTGNPRLILTVAEVRSASPDVERHLQAKFDQWALRGEWFERAPLLEQVADAGGWEELLRRQLGQGNWHIDANP